MNEPKPRDITDHLQELTAVVETLRVAIGSLVVEAKDRQRVLQEYDQGIAHLEAISLGKVHSERYLEYLEEHAKKTRLFLSV